MIRKGMFIVNRYEILQKVGSGGMSDVYKAKDHKLNRFVAVKVLKQDYSEDKNFVSKFRVEAQNAAGLMHNNIVNVYDVGEEQGIYFIVMELIEGITLKQYIARKGKLSFKEALSIAIQIAQGIECAHNNQIIHRDIKPQNIIISRDGKVKVTDFGIARAASVNTHTTNAMGSVHYMSPEQAKGSMVDAKSDIYSLGITMYEMITGHVPFDGDSTVTIALQHIKNQVPSVREEIEDIPISVEKIILKCTQNKPERRYLKISSLISDLKKALLNPNSDFVHLESDDENGTTVMITPDEMKVIRNGADEEDIRNSNSSYPDSEQRKKKSQEMDEYDEDDPFDDEGNTFMERIVLVGGVIIVIVVVISTLLTITKLFGGSFSGIPGIGVEKETVDDKHATVPNLIGRTEDEARTALNEINLGIKYQYDYDENYANGLVCAQSEKEGRVVEKNTTIIVTVSKGPERVELPGEIVGMQFEEAIDTLEAAGFKWKVEFEYSAKKKLGCVIKTDPEDVGEVPKGETITLTVSRGTEGNADGIKLVYVPNVIGKKVEDARNELGAAGLGIGEVIEVYSDTVKKGRVIRVNARAGAGLPFGSSVGMIVSLGKEEPETEEPTTVEITTEAESESVTEELTSDGGAEVNYSGSVTFALEDLKDIEGSPVTSGVVSIFVDDVAQAVNPAYSNVENWPGDYVFTYESKEPITVEVRLAVNGVTISTTTMTLTER